jgi:hypothetical protein
MSIHAGLEMMRIKGKLMKWRSRDTIQKGIKISGTKSSEDQI